MLPPWQARGTQRGRLALREALEAETRPGLLSRISNWSRGGQRNPLKDHPQEGELHGNCAFVPKDFRWWKGGSVPAFFLPSAPPKHTCTLLCIHTQRHTRTHTHIHRSLQTTAFTGFFFFLTLQVGLLVSHKHTWHLFLDLISLMKGTRDASQAITALRINAMHLFILDG